MNRAGSPLHRTGRCSPQAFLFFKERYLGPRPVEGIFYRRQKDNEVKRLRSRRAISMNLFSGSIQSMEDLLRKSKKGKRGATLEEANIDSAWLRAYARIARRFREDRYLGFSNYPHELSPGVSPFADRFFEHRRWANRRGTERHPSLRPLFEYEALYINSAGY
jgi:hypothetical protein